MRYEPAPPHTEPKKEDDGDKFVSAAASSAPPNEMAATEKATDKAPSPELVGAASVPINVPEPVAQEAQAPVQTAEPVAAQPEPVPAQAETAEP